MRSSGTFWVAALLLPGCIAPGFLSSGDGLRDWEPLPCDPTKSDERSVLAEHAPDPGADMGAFAARFGQALEDPVRSPSPTTGFDGRSEWRTGQGMIRTRHPIDEETLLEYEARRLWPGLDPQVGRSSLEAFAKRVGLPGEVLVNYTSRAPGQMDGRIQQAFGGRAVGTTATTVTYVERDANDTFVRLALRPFWVLPGAERRVDDARALDIGQRFMRCQMDAAGRTQAKGYDHRHTGFLYDWLPIHDRSLAYAVVARFNNPMGGSCPAEKSEGTVYVDAWTGSVLTWDWNRCGRLTNATA